jgi:hypothetical protein
VSVARDTRGGGHPGGAYAVESGVIHQHHVHEKKPLNPDRPARCLRHSVWMAVCDDCRAARADLVSGGPKATAAR